ncbi:helix-turn-helix domain-containing protein [Amycolatopsis sp. NBC_00438]|uniref:helix-turn-helix domain-containing protein n=1 Tax=Amycolatopsis sp. NBC_00438 TaxID=2903558 RepID=UPI002E1F4223
MNRLLAEWGSHEKLTMRAVAKEVGVAAPSSYRHFADKTELVWAAPADKYEQLAHAMRVADAAVAAGDPRGKLLATRTRARPCRAASGAGRLGAAARGGLGSDLRRASTP